MNAIKIYNNPGEILAVELKDVLNCISGGESRKWSILYLEMTGDIGRPVPDFEDSIGESEKGMVLEWSGLIELAGKIHQAIEILLIGDADSSKIRRYDTDEEMNNTCEYTIELVDSSYWLIHSTNASNLDKIKRELDQLAFVKEF